MTPTEKNYDFWLLINNGVDLKNRKIYFSGEVEDVAGDACLSAIDYFNSPRHCPQTFEDPITIIINSPGGCVDYMFAIYEAIINSNADIHTIVSGQACSAASLILVAGDKRFAYETSWVMVHKVSTGLSGHDDEVIAGAAVTQRMSSRYWQALGRHTKLSAAKWLGLVRKKAEVWMSASELLERGVVDEIIKPTRRQFAPFVNKNLNV